LRHDVVVFDFDGTLVDSNEIKSVGFNHAFADREECVAAVAEVLASHKRLTRLEIVAALVDRIEGLSREQHQQEAARRVALYSAWVEERILAKAKLSPAGELLERWHARASLYVCSLTPREYLATIVERAGWQKYFVALAGAPVRKSEMLRATAARHGLKPHDVLMVGDSADDEAAASDAQTSFFRIRQVSDLIELDRYLTT
jgi:phosphoglycolate phosphatase-like HAD superfamily hydrolase